MSDVTFITIVVVVGIDLVVAVLVTRAIGRRKYTDERKTLLLWLTWLVPGIGALCAAVAMRERDHGASSEPTRGK